MPLGHRILAQPISRVLSRGEGHIRHGAADWCRHRRGPELRLGGGEGDLRFGHRGLGGADGERALATALTGTVLRSPRWLPRRSSRIECSPGGGGVGRGCGPCGGGPDERVDRLVDPGLLARPAAGPARWPGGPRCTAQEHRRPPDWSLCWWRKASRLRSPYPWARRCVWLAWRSGFVCRSGLVWRFRSASAWFPEPACRCAAARPAPPWRWLGGWRAEPRAVGRPGPVLDVDRWMAAAAARLAPGRSRVSRRVVMPASRRALRGCGGLWCHGTRRAVVADGVALFVAVSAAAS